MTRDEKWILYDGDDQLSGWALDWEKAPKNFPKPNLHPKKKKRVMVTVWWSATDLIHYCFLNTGKTITSEKCAQQIKQMHQKLPCLLLSLVNRMGPILHNTQLLVTQPTLQKLNQLGYEVWPHPPYSLDLLPPYYHFFKHLNNFLQGKYFHNQQEAENAFQEFVKSWSKDFYSTGISKLTSCWQKWVNCNGSYFDLIKMCLSLVIMI